MLTHRPGMARQEIDEGQRRDRGLKKSHKVAVAFAKSDRDFAKARGHRPGLALIGHRLAVDAHHRLHE